MRQGLENGGGRGGREGGGGIREGGDEGGGRGDQILKKSEVK